MGCQSLRYERGCQPDTSSAIDKVISGVENGHQFDSLKHTVRSQNKSKNIPCRGTETPISAPNNALIYFVTPSFQSLSAASQAFFSVSEMGNIQIMKSMCYQSTGNTMCMLKLK